MEATDSGKHSSLLRYCKNEGCKIFYSTGLLKKIILTASQKCMLLSLLLPAERYEPWTFGTGVDAVTTALELPPLKKTFTLEILDILMHRSRPRKMSRLAPKLWPKRSETKGQRVYKSFDGMSSFPEPAAARFEPLNLDYSTTVLPRLMPQKRTTRDQCYITSFARELRIFVLS